MRAQALAPAHALALVRALLRRLLPAGVALGLLAAPAAALTSAEAGRVVAVLETLEPEYGNFAYDEEIADEWFERDAQERRVIAAQGFSQAGWKAALDATMRGYLASIPQAKIDGLFAQIQAELASSGRMSAEQRQAAREWADEERAKLGRLRAEGVGFLPAVRPHLAKLEKLLPDAGPGASTAD